MSLAYTKTKIKSLSPQVEFAIVSVLACGFFFVGSVLHLLSAYGSPAITNSHLLQVFLYETAVLPVLWWFLRQRSWTASKIGALPSIIDLPMGVVLSIATYAVGVATWILVAVLVPEAAESARGIELTDRHLNLAAVVAVSVLNPVFEEMYLCGYVLTFLDSKVKVPTAVNVSVGLRLSYHLYQGPLALIAVVPMGLVFTSFYARSRRLWPIIVAHAIFDFIGLAWYT